MYLSMTIDKASMDGYTYKTSLSLGFSVCSTKKMPLFCKLGTPLSLFCKLGTTLLLLFPHLISNIAHNESKYRGVCKWYKSKNIEVFVSGASC